MLTSCVRPDKPHKDIIALFAKADALGQTGVMQAVTTREYTKVMCSTLVTLLLTVLVFSQPHCRRDSSVYPLQADVFPVNPAG